MKYYFIMTLAYILINIFYILISEQISTLIWQMNICRAYMDCKEPPLSYQDDDFNFFFYKLSCISWSSIYWVWTFSFKLFVRKFFLIFKYTVTIFLFKDMLGSMYHTDHVSCANEHVQINEDLFWDLVGAKKLIICFKC